MPRPAPWQARGGVPGGSGGRRHPRRAGRISRDAGATGFKDAPDDEGEREPDEDEEDAAAGDVVALEERLRRSLRKSQRFASALGMDSQEALLWYERDQVGYDSDSHRKRIRE